MIISTPHYAMLGWYKYNSFKYLVIIESRRFNRIEITWSNRKRRYKNSIGSKFRGVKNKRKIALRSGGIVGWVFTNIVRKKMI